MFFLYSCTVFYFIMIKLINLSLQILFGLFACKNKIKELHPGYSTVPDSKISNSMRKVLIFQVKYKSTIHKIKYKI